MPNVYGLPDDYVLLTDIYTLAQRLMDDHDMGVHQAMGTATSLKQQLEPPPSDELVMYATVIVEQMRKLLAPHRSQVNIVVSEQSTRGSVAVSVSLDLGMEWWANHEFTVAELTKPHFLINTLPRTLDRLSLEAVAKYMHPAISAAGGDALPGDSTVYEIVTEIRQRLKPFPWIRVVDKDLPTRASIIVTLEMGPTHSGEHIIIKSDLRHPDMLTTALPTLLLDEAKAVLQQQVMYPIMAEIREAVVALGEPPKESNFDETSGQSAGR